MGNAEWGMRTSFRIRHSPFRIQRVGRPDCPPSGSVPPCGRRSNSEGGPPPFAIPNSPFLILPVCHCSVSSAGPLPPLSTEGGSRGVRRPSNAPYRRPLWAARHYFPPCQGWTEGGRFAGRFPPVRPNEKGLSPTFSLFSFQSSPGWPRPTAFHTPHPAGDSLPDRGVFVSFGSIRSCARRGTAPRLVGA